MADSPRMSHHADPDADPNQMIPRTAYRLLAEKESEVRTERDRLRRAIVEHRTTIHNAGTVRVDSRDEAAAEAKRAADARLWASVGLEGSSL